MHIIVKVKNMDKKSLYNSINELSKIYYNYYINMKKIHRVPKGIMVCECIKKLQDDICELYFTDKDTDILLNTHKLDFLIRDLYNCNIISSKQKISLSRVISKILTSIKS